MHLDQIQGFIGRLKIWGYYRNYRNYRAACRPDHSCLKAVRSFSWVRLKKVMCPLFTILNASGCVVKKVMR